MTARGRSALRLGVAATLDHQRLLAELQPAFVVDVGANRGQFALDVKVACPSTPLLCFEPIPDVAARFREVFGADENVELRNVALGTVPGESELYVSKADDSSSLLPISQLQQTTFPGTEAIGTISVPVSTLDVELKKATVVSPAMLKLDVQGYELEVLRGGAESLASFDWIYVECSFREFYDGQPLAADVIAFLAAKGFDLDRVETITRVSGSVVQADILFARHSSKTW